MLDFMTAPSLSGPERVQRHYVGPPSKGKERVMLRGSIPALVTPFRDEAFDEATFRAFVEWQIGEGSHGLVPCGTTGESATLKADEHKLVV